MHSHLRSALASASLLTLAALGCHEAITRHKPDVHGDSGSDSATPSDTGADSAVPDTDTDTGAPPDLLPDGRGYYVVSMFGGTSSTTRWSILRTLALTANDATQGAVESDSWAWYQDRFTGDASVNKVETGYTTAGGPYDGVVRTPLGFAPGSAGTALHGVYALGGDGPLTIT